MKVEFSVAKHSSRTDTEVFTDQRRQGDYSPELDSMVKTVVDGHITFTLRPVGGSQLLLSERQARLFHAMLTEALK